MITNAQSILKLRMILERYRALPWYKKLWFRITAWKLSVALSSLTPNASTLEKVKEISDLLSHSWFYTTAFGILKDFDYTFFASHRLDRVLPNTGLGNQLPLLNPFLDKESRMNIGQLNHAFFDHYNLERLGFKFLQHLVRRELNQAKQMLEAVPTLFKYRGNVKDYSNRKFIAISGFEYSLWALDGLMSKMIINSLPKQDPHNKYRRVLQCQYENYKGIVYQLNKDLPILELHYDFIKPISLMRKYCDEYDTLTYVERWSLWCQTLGKEQRLFPVHVAYNHCIPHEKDATEIFDESSLEIIHQIPYKNALYTKYSSWWGYDYSSFDSGILGHNVAVGRSGGLIHNSGFGALVVYSGVGFYDGSTIEHVTKDLLDFKQLSEKSQSDFYSLKTLLGSSDSLELKLDDCPSNLKSVAMQ
ncbi:MAG: hypothetical protein H0U75_04380 [Legionella sp.]|nr:hypothetical protein [Legionella sp.]